MLLQLLAGVLPPTTGRIEFYGPVTSLLAIGDNLDLRSTAIENLQASPLRRAGHARGGGALHRRGARLRRAARIRARRRFAPISTGMVLRLSVAMALCGRPSIVLIDDVLNVGDIGFQQKCLDRVQALKDAGCTLVLALSDETFVQRIATRV